MDRRLIALFGIAIFVASCTIAPAPTLVAAKVKGPDKQEPSLIEGYKSWHKVNANPLSIDVMTSTMCMDPRAEVRKFAKIDPHTMHFITVYVNDIGKDALLKVHSGKQPFPVGTIIVKEKFVGFIDGEPVKWGIDGIGTTKHDFDARQRAAVPDGAKPVLMTVMVKREKGFNPKCFDWEFLTYEPSKHEPLSQGKLATCQSCHTMRPKQDGVFASYVPWPAR